VEKAREKHCHWKTLYGVIHFWPQGRFWLLWFTQEKNADLH